MQKLGDLSAQAAGHVTDWLNDLLGCLLDGYEHTNRCNDQDHQYPDHQNPWK
jgi:hypothetical protein